MSHDELIRITLTTLACILGLIRYAYRRQAHSHQADREVVCWYKDQHTTIIILWLGTVTAYLAGWLPGADTLPIPAWVRWVGIVGTAACVPLSVWVYGTLGPHFSSELQVFEGHRLVTDGPYRWVRHPMYSTLFLCIISIGVASASIPVMSVGIIAIYGMLPRIDREECMMLRMFGHSYLTYMGSTGSMLPRIWS